MASKNQLIEQLSNKISEEEKKISRLSNLKFTNGERVARKIIKNAKIHLARLKFELENLNAEYN